MFAHVEMHEQVIRRYEGEFGINAEYSTSQKSDRAEKALWRASPIKARVLAQMWVGFVGLSWLISVCIQSQRVSAVLRTMGHFLHLA
jgi:hypothetical protein